MFYNSVNTKYRTRGIQNFFIYSIFILQETIINDDCVCIKKVSYYVTIMNTFIYIYGDAITHSQPNKLLDGTIFIPMSSYHNWNI